MAKIGEVICGKYEVLTLLGKGGMSYVYLVMDKKLQKKWAVKEIIRYGGGLLFAESAKTEVNVMKKLDHPALPRIVDVLEDIHHIYVVMDYVEGKNLEELLKKEAYISREKVLKWAKELCGVLEYLHGQKPPIIYRDLKPTNIMITQSGSVKLIDFGIVREYKETGETDTVNLGTVGYASPEQLSGKKQTDERSDIYSLGMTLYYILTGEHPWKVSGNLFGSKRRNAKLSGAWEYIIRNCTLRNPNYRYQNCKEIMRDLDNFEKLDRIYQRKMRGKEYVQKVGKRIVTILLWGMILYMLPEAVKEFLKAEKARCFSAFKEILDSFFQKVYYFFHL